MKLYSFCLASMLVLAGVCGAAEETEAPKSPTTQPALPAGVVIKVNDSALTQATVDSMRKYLVPQWMKLTDLANRWTDDELMAQEARRRGIDKDPDAKRIMKVMEAYVLKTILIKQIQQAEKVTEEDIKKYYEENKDKPMFRESDRVTFTFIAVETENKGELEKIKKQVDEGASWDEMVKKHEERSCQVTGLPTATVKEMPLDDLRSAVGPQFRFNVQRAKLNEVTGPRKFRRGWMLVKLTAKEKGPQKSYEQMKERIKPIVERQKKGQAARKLQEELKAKATIIKSQQLLEAEKKAAKQPNRQGRGPR